MKVKVIIADDHSMIREALKQLLDLENDIQVVATADNGEKALELIDVHKPNVVLLDINMPVLDGISTLREIKNSKSKLMNSVKVIMLTVHKDSEHILKAVDIANKEDIILLAGKGHEQYQIIGEEKIPFSEKDIIKEL